MRKLLGVITIIGGALLGIYLALYVCLFGGIVQVIHGVTQHPTPDAIQIAGGIVRVLVTGFVGWATFALCFFMGAWLHDSGRLSQADRLRSMSRGKW